MNECQHKKVVILDNVEVDEELKDIVKLLEKKDIHIICSCQESHGKSYLDIDLSDFKDLIYTLQKMEEDKKNKSFLKFIKKCSTDLSFDRKRGNEKDEEDELEIDWTVTLWFKPTDIKYIVENLKLIK
jgi:hypothetical protein